jgi:hypothetical protein
MTDAGATITENATTVAEQGAERMGIDYNDVVWIKTNERLTPQTFGTYRKQGGMVVIYCIPEPGSSSLSPPLTR